MTEVMFLQLFIVRVTLMFLEPQIPYTKFAEDLILGTAAQESLLGKLVFKRQDLAMYQMLESTERDHWKTYLPKYPVLIKKIRELQKLDPRYYAVAMVRVQYHRYFPKFPDFDLEMKEHRIEDMARLWKVYYNTHSGSGTMKQFKSNYYRLVLKERRASK